MKKQESMFTYTVPTVKQQAILPRLQAHHDRAVTKGLKTVRIEDNMKLTTLCARILKERWARTEHIPCPLLDVRAHSGGLMVHVAQAASFKSDMHPDKQKPSTIIPLKDYWYTILVGQRRPDLD